MSRCRKGNFVERAAGNCARRARQQAIRSTYELFPKPKRSRKKQSFLILILNFSLRRGKCPDKTPFCVYFVQTAKTTPPLLTTKK